MSSFFFGEIFGDLMQELDQIRKVVESRELKGKWNDRQIDKSGVKGYVIQVRFRPDQPLEPFDPYEPINPWKRPPMPQRELITPESPFKEIREPLTDVFEEEGSVKVYVQLPGGKREDIQLNVTEGNVEVKAKNFYRMISIPRNLDIERASSNFKNAVLTITIPKKESPENLYFPSFVE